MSNQTITQNTLIPIGLALTIAAGTWAVASTYTDIRKDIDSIKVSHVAMQKDIGDIKELLAKKIADASKAVTP